MEKDFKIPNIGVVLSEDSESVEVLFQGFDMCNFLLEMANKELDCEKSEEVLTHIRALHTLFEKPLRQRYEFKACVWKNRYAVANEKPKDDE